MFCFPFFLVCGNVQKGHAYIGLSKEGFQSEELIFITLIEC